MYVIRVDHNRTLLKVECSGHITTAEAVRAISQAFALAEAGNIWAMAVDVTAVTIGPDEIDVVGAALAASHRLGTRIAFVTGTGTRTIVDRLRRLSGVPDAAGAFESDAGARAWLETALRSGPRRPLEDGAPAAARATRRSSAA